MRKSLIMLLVLAMLAVLIGGCGSKDRADQISSGQPGSEEQEIVQADSQKDKDGNKDRLSGTGETDPDAAGNETQDPETGNNADANGNEAADTRNTGNSSTGNTGNSNGSNTSNSNGTGSGSAVVSTSGNAGSGSNTDNAGNNNSGSSSGNSGSNTGNTGSSGTVVSTSPAETHTHSWVEQFKTVHHEEEYHYETKTVVDQEARDEEIKEARVVCGCGRFFETIDAWDDHGIDDGCIYGYSVKKVVVDTVHHAAVTHTEQVRVVDKAAWDEQVSAGYKCSLCGATK